MRFTPTHVGNTLSVLLIAFPLSVHPHTRGEYIGKIEGLVYPFGSPPHTWGILPSPPISWSARRFTPTHVGNTFQLLPSSSDSHGSPPHTWGIPIKGHLDDVNAAVHPHTRGEYSHRSRKSAVLTGSPPHTWGILERKDVGNQCKPVHPHTRGEYTVATSLCSQNNGSPPHTWGILVLKKIEQPFLRFTPTHVGNTLQAQS